jgi:hypothetical protein
MKMMKSAAQDRAANARRQREYRQRHKAHVTQLRAKALEGDTLEDAIRLAANKGDGLAIEICQAIQYPNTVGLTGLFTERATRRPAKRGASRNPKKPATAK